MLTTRYRIDDELARDTEARTLRAHDDEHERPVVVMIPNPSRVGANTDSPRWTGTGVDHPNLLQPYDAGAYRDVPFVVAERSRPTTLLHELEHGAASSPRVEAVAHGLIAGLAELHESGFVHGHLAPGTIAVTDGAPQLAPAPLAPTPRAGPAVALGGERAYRAPELAPAEPAGVAADLWATGAILHAALTGEAPEHAGAAPSRRRGPHRFPLSRRRPDAEPSLVSVVERALAPDPTQRFSSALDMLAALDATAMLDLADPSLNETPTNRRWRAAACVAAGVGLLIGIHSGFDAGPVTPAAGGSRGSRLGSSAITASSPLTHVHGAPFGVPNIVTTPPTTWPPVGAGGRGSLRTGAAGAAPTGSSVPTPLPPAAADGTSPSTTTSTSSTSTTTTPTSGGQAGRQSGGQSGAPSGGGPGSGPGTGGTGHG